MIGRLGGERAREEIRSYRATRPLLRDTISLTMFQAGYKINVIPEQAELSLDCRLLPDTDEREFIARLEQIVDDPADHLRASAGRTPPPRRPPGTPPARSPPSSRRAGRTCRPAW